MNRKRHDLLLFSVLSFGLLPGAMAETFYVKNTADDGPGSFRAALEAASGAGPGPHRIEFKLWRRNRTIVLTSGGLEYNNPNNADLSIIGQKGATVDGASSYRILHSVSTGKLSISKLHFQHGFAEGGSGFGGALQVVGDLLVRSCGFAHNQADQSGGAISHLGRGIEIYIEDSEFDWNATGGFGGAVFVPNPLSTTTITGSKFRDNNAGRGGGVLYAASTGATLSVVDSVFERNSGRLGGAMAVGGGPVHIVRSTFLDNEASESDGSPALGGAIATAASPSPVEIADSLFKRNRSAKFGGAFATGAPGSLSVNNSSFEENEAAQGGGAIFIAITSPIEVVGSTFTNNHTGDVGGAIFVEAPFAFRVEGSLFEGNGAEKDGGAVFLSGEVGTDEAIIRDSSFTGNQAGGVGGALGLGDDAKVLTEHVTMTNNHAQSGGGVGADSDDPETGLTLVYSTVVDNEATVGANLQLNTPLVSQNSVIALPRGGENCNVSAASGSFNYVDDDGSCTIIGSGNQTGNNPNLNPLRDNGGPVPTRKLRSFSPLIDAIETHACYAYGVVEDARGVPRPQIKGCDIGAVEVDGRRGRWW